MFKPLATLALLSLAPPLWAQDAGDGGSVPPPAGATATGAATAATAATVNAAPLVAAAVSDHVLPGYDRLARTSRALADTAGRHCTPEDADLRNAYGAAFDAWIAVSHLRFGPAETANRAYALAFWPDSRGATPKALSGLIDAQDPVIDSADSFADVSIAGRGFYALEYLLFDDRIAASGDAAYRCALVRAVATDIARTSAAIRDDWQAEFAETMRSPGPTARYRSAQEAAQELFKALATGLEFTADTRLGRPLGTFERPRPNRAEARRSGRSLRHVMLSLQATRDLALLLAQGQPGVTSSLTAAFDTAQANAAALAEDPVFAGVDDPSRRLKVEILQQSIGHIRDIVAQELGPHLGVAAGFNALDGD
ncbi:imelysin family protein [Pseudooceanicola aestuarii]|uniref:imelysin family protein n=1 Tax=Pseudooceanicola aestuarii TaxID=2697319 RepID=UPI0013D8803D|nr:imelysin family protein [Pseudooceanicola aestuarii]